MLEELTLEKFTNALLFASLKPFFPLSLYPESLNILKFVFQKEETIHPNISHSEFRNKNISTWFQDLVHICHLEAKCK